MFRTPIENHICKYKINKKDTILLLGSCFAEHIGQKIKENKFNSLINPFGILFNPISLFAILTKSIHQKKLPQSTYIKNNDIYYNFMLHSKHSSQHLPTLKKHIDNIILLTHQFIKHTNWITITLGTAWVYKKDNKIVANCHKLPNKLFKKELLNVNKITHTFNRCYTDLKKINPNVKIILTVSPIRHIKDTLELNAVSKSILRLACHHITQENENVYYFPAYEIMQDDLRDYRFYESDMLHPNTTATQYIWEHFMHTFFDSDTQLFIEEWQKVIQCINHKPFNPSSLQHQKFILNTINKLEKLSNQIDISEEISALKKQLL